MLKLSQFRKVLTVVILLTLAGSSSAATMCDQTFHFIAKGGNTLWIGEDLDGQCKISYLITIMLSGSDAGMSKCELLDYQEWTRFENAFIYLDTEDEVEFTEESNHNWTDFWIDFQINHPEDNNELFAKFEEHVRKGGSNGKTWNKAMGPKGIVEPTFEDASASLVYAFPEGLYVNYEISDVYYFERSKYLLIFTKNNHAGVGLDTMHGFLIYKVTKIVE